MAAAAATRFGSASGITISGALEPSSMVTRLRPATLQIRSPMSRLPVKVILRTRGSLHRALPRLLPGPVRHCTASGGAPASTNNSISLRADSGVSVAGLMMQALPAAIAGPTLWHTRCSGKLNGLMPTTTPHGTRRVKPSLPFTPGAPSSGITSPERRFASSADSTMISRARVASICASARILPSSWVMVRARSSARSRIRSATFISIS